MNLDRFIAESQPAWDRLRVLTDRAGRGLRHLYAAELDELVRLYQRVSTHLSLARSAYRDPGLVELLTRLTARAGSVIYGVRPRTWRGFLRFVTDTFPAAVWHSRWFVVTSTLCLVVPAVIVAVWIANSTAALQASAPEALRESYVEEDFEAYYSNLASVEFATLVTTNNIRVGIMAFAAGILLCVPTAYILALNGANVGFAAGLFAAAGQQPRFWGLILPHGMLELTAVLIAGAAGLRLGWALVDPGDRPRGAALTDEARRAVAIVIGLVGVFVVAGLIEGFVSGSTLPTWARVGIGALTWAVFCVYIVVRGIAATRRGMTGAIGEQDEAGWVASDA
jgi:uncharacterized membrane protein SpoIIM required for sporulation